MGTTSPKRAGFYWAKWLTAERETRYAQMLTRSDDWEIVWVFENSTDQQHEDFLRVLVIGVEASQSIRNFEWRPGPLARREGEIASDSRGGTALPLRLDPVRTAMGGLFRIEGACAAAADADAGRENDRRSPPLRQQIA